MQALVGRRAFVMVGLPGSGKSTLAQEISRRTGAVYFSSDAIREEVLASKHFTDAGNVAVPKYSAIAYEIMLERSREILSLGGKVILDATHLQIAKRAKTLAGLLTVISPTEILLVCVRPSRANMEKWLAKRTELANATETYFQAWQRVISYFDQELKDGTAAWPDQADGIAIIETNERAQLDFRT